MKEPFQRDMPKSRINLSVDVRVDGKTKTVSLPHKTLVMGDFSAGKNKLSVHDRERKPVTQDTFDVVMKDISPSLPVMVNGVLVTLTFESSQDFHPESLAQQVPSLKRLLAVRNLLKDLKANMSDNHALKEALKEMLQSPEQIKQFQEDMKHVVQPSVTE